MASSYVGPARTLASGVVALCAVRTQGVAVAGCEQKFQIPGQFSQKKLVQNKLVHGEFNKDMRLIQHMRALKG